MNTFGKIQFLNNADIQEVLKMDQSYFTPPWSAEQWLNINWETHLLYSWQGIEDVSSTGFVLFGLVPGDEVAHLLKILILPKHRGSGQAEEFFQTVSVELKSFGVERIYLEVESQNTRAIGFYKKMGFKRLRVNKSYYSNGEDADIMDLVL